MRKWVVLRRISQAGFLALFIYILWSNTYPLKSILPPDTFFKFDPLIVFFTSISERIFLKGIIFSLVMVVLTLIFGRFFCGWVCPLGATIDMAQALRKPPSLKDADNKKLRFPKFVLLGAMFALAVFGVQAAWIADPIVIMARFISLNVIPVFTMFLDKAFMTVIKAFGLYGFLYDFYRTLKFSILGVKISYFNNAAPIFLFFLFVAGSSLFIKRFWCRAICPLGAFYALLARFSLLKRRVSGCSYCGRCKSECRMGAIKDNMGYLQGECILCMDCVYECPQHITRFGWGLFDKKAKKSDKGILAKNAMSRGQFIFLMASSVIFSGRRPKNKLSPVPANGLIRPPGSLEESEFLNRCIRCGNCMKVCITNGLQPAFLQAGPQGIWTPRLVPEIGYCEYECTLCGNTCPTAAIPALSPEEKKSVRLGTAEIDRSICIPWASGEDCIVCQEHCPVSDKAIKLEPSKVGSKQVMLPYIVEDLCVGCGICQNKCPVRPKRAVTVSPRNAGRHSGRHKTA